MIAITGTHGFIGQALIRAMRRQGLGFKALRREEYGQSSAYKGCDTVIWLAAIAHSQNVPAPDHLKINTNLVISGARAARAAGVRRFVFVSSSKALCDFAIDSQPIHEDAKGHPGSSYGRSKRQAELALLKIHAEGPMAIVVVRPALVIGSPPKGNLLHLARVARSKIAPLAAIALRGFDQPRSYTSLGMLCQFLCLSVRDPRLDGRIVHAVDDHPMSAYDLFQGLRNAQTSVSDGLVTVATEAPPPPSWAKALALLVSGLLTVLGKREWSEALGKPFVLDSSIRELSSGCVSEVTMVNELREIMAGFISSEDKFEGSSPL